MNGDTTTHSGFLARVIALCAANPFFTILLVGAATAWGVYATRNAALDAIPDLSDVQVIVFTEWPGQKPGPGGGSDHVSDFGAAARRA